MVVLFLFSVILKPKKLLYSVFIDYLIAPFISFAASVISMFKNAYFNQYHFNIVLFTYNRNIAGWFINRNKSKTFFGVPQVYDVFWIRARLDLDDQILVLSFKVFFQPLLKWQTFMVLKIPQMSFYQKKVFL